MPPFYKCDNFPRICVDLIRSTLISASGSFLTRGVVTTDKFDTFSIHFVSFRSVCEISPHWKRFLDGLKSHIFHFWSWNFAELNVDRDLTNFRRTFLLCEHYLYSVCIHFCKSELVNTCLNFGLENWILF